MAVRRMFSREVCETDAFLDLSVSAQRLYFFLGLAADDEGFLQNANSVMRLVGSSRDDMNLLIAKNFVIPFASGVVVIRHWAQHNYIPKDRFHPTKCIAEKALLSQDANKNYELSGPVYSTGTPCIQPVYKPYPEGREGKRRVEVYAHAREAAPAAPPSPGLLSEDELTALSDDHDRAQQLIRRYGLPDGFVSLDALLEDAQTHGWEALEAALKAASLSNSRKGLSVNFYRSVLNGTGAKSGGDPYAGFECL